VPAAEAMAVISRILSGPTAQEAVAVAPAPRSYRGVGGLVLTMAAAGCAALVLLWSSGPAPQSRVISADRSGPPATVVTTPGSRPSASAPASSPTSALIRPEASAPGQPTVVLPSSSTPAAAACPQGVPLAEVDQVVTQVDPASVNSLPEPSVLQTTVTGTLRNPATASVVVAGLQVEVHFEGLPATEPATQTVSALSAPATLSPGAVLSWTVTTKTKKPEPGPVRATAHVTVWNWAEPALAACSH